MPRLELAVVRIVVVEVAETCPRCASNLCDATASPLREVSLRQHTFRDALDVDGDEAHVDVEDAEGEAPSGYLPVMYQCAACSYVLAGDGAAAEASESLAS